jgi:hypothetical protein
MFGNQASVGNLGLGTSPNNWYALINGKSKEHEAELPPLAAVLSRKSASN